MALDEHLIALIAAGELAERAGVGAACAHLYMDELEERTGCSTPRLLREIEEAVAAGRFRVTAVEIEAVPDA